MAAAGLEPLAVVEAQKLLLMRLGPQVDARLVGVACVVRLQRAASHVVAAHREVAGRLAEDEHQMEGVH